MNYKVLVDGEFIECVWLPKNTNINDAERLWAKKRDIGSGGVEFKHIGKIEAYLLSR